MADAMKVLVPPIKSQGIKTKLVPWIRSILPRHFEGVWVEPFMGTGAVGFNLAPDRALMCDINPHLVNFYLAIQREALTPRIAKEFLTGEGRLLLERGQDHYYEIRERFNKTHDPLDFLFLNRAGFNGMIRFNKSGEFNIPFCRKPNRFAQAYVTKITNQVSNISRLIKTKDFTFKCQPFEETIKSADYGDIIYCDPPYIDRHTDYYSNWNDSHERQLLDSLSEAPCNFILSTWHHNDFRSNRYVDELWSGYNVLTRNHFYHVGGSESNRNPMVEALVTNFQPVQSPVSPFTREQTVFSEILTT